MSEQPTEYGKELIAAVRDAVRDEYGSFLCAFDMNSVRGCAINKAPYKCRCDAVARAALLAACAKLKEPPEKTLDEMDVVYCEAGIEAALSWYFSRLLTEIGT